MIVFSVSIRISENLNICSKRQKSLWGRSSIVFAVMRVTEEKVRKSKTFLVLAETANYIEVKNLKSKVVLK